MKDTFQVEFQPRRAVALSDHFQSSSNELMFLAGENVIILQDWTEGIYLGLCSGVLGLLHAANVRILEDHEMPDFKLPPLTDLQKDISPGLIRDMMKGSFSVLKLPAQNGTSTLTNGEVNGTSSFVSNLTNEEANGSLSPNGASPSSTPIPAKKPSPQLIAQLTQRQLAEQQLSTQGWREAEPTQPATSQTLEEGALVDDDGVPKRSILDETNTDEYGFEITEEGGQSKTQIDPEKYRERTVKWKKMLEPPKGYESKPFSEKGLSQWEKFYKSNTKKVIERCRKGIPRPMRGPAWYAMSGAASLKAKWESKDYVDFRQFYKKDVKSEILEVIDRDIDRCYPTHIAFRNHGSPAQNDLEDILKAYSFFDSKIGYCQGMGMIAGMMLMHLTAEDAFWLLAATLASEKYTKNFYDASLSQVKRMATVFDSLLHGHLPKVAAHLDKNGLEPLMYVTPWFMTLYTTTLPWSTVLRIWDMFYCEGERVLLQVALAIVTLCADDLLTKCPSLPELLPYMLKIPLAKLSQNVLIPLAQEIKIKDSELIALHRDVNQVATRKRRF